MYTRQHKCFSTVCFCCPITHVPPAPLGGAQAACCCTSHAVHLLSCPSLSSGEAEMEEQAAAFHETQRGAHGFSRLPLFSSTNLHFSCCLSTPCSPLLSSIAPVPQSMLAQATNQVCFSNSCCSLQPSFLHKPPLLMSLLGHVCCC